MGVSTEDLFGDASGAQLATPGTYGLPPAAYRLPDETRLGPVRLQVADLSRSLAFYEGTLGLQALHRDEARVVLGVSASGTALVELVERPGAQAVPGRGRIGLYHFAILLPDRASLGRFVQHLGQIGARAGSADHLVSEALYLQDPDNLGIEVYADRPRSSWKRIGRELMMASDPLDYFGLLREAGTMPWTGMPAGTTMGHVHLHVRDTAVGSAFFSDALGFDRMAWQYPGALFFGAGGYHHHLGTNTWAGTHAPLPTERDAQLLEWTLELPDLAALEAAAESVGRAGHAIARAASPDGPAFRTRDPWGTALILKAR